MNKYTALLHKIYKTKLCSSVTADSLKRRCIGEKLKKVSIFWACYARISVSWVWISWKLGLCLAFLLQQLNMR